MSRSYKHTPMCKDKTSYKFGKRYANRVVRKSSKKLAMIGGEETPLKGNIAKKMFETWDICDFKFGPESYEFDVLRAKELSDLKVQKEELRKIRTLYINK